MSRLISRYRISNEMIPLLFHRTDNLHNGYIDLNGFIKIVSIIQLVQLKMQMYDPQNTGHVTLDLNGLLDIVMSLPLYACLEQTEK